MRLVMPPSARLGTGRLSGAAPLSFSIEMVRGCHAISRSFDGRTSSRLQTRVEPRRGWQAGDLENLLLAQRLPRNERSRKRVELLTMRGEQPLGFLVALRDDLANLFVNRFRRLFT